MFGLNATIDQLAMANSVPCYGHVLMCEGGHVLERALDYKVGGQKKIWRLQSTLRRKV